ncbi:MAG: hypothetical protein E7101_14790 [Prevotella ruminicola]|uniref:Uncharacterized protein n=1 Tax=Xylanibacter ruminicola TaxID=839 RepID=A0A9D5P7F7_XYLRU|nr:hypothetical protein [Xylanibacter ruminicola]
MATLFFIAQLAVVLAMIFVGAKVGSIGLGIYGMVGVFVLVFCFGLEPGVIPVDVMLIIVCVIGTFENNKRSLYAVLAGSYRQDALSGGLGAGCAAACAACSLPSRQRLFLPA